MLLSGKVAIVAGTGPGLGKSIAEALLANGARVGLLARRGEVVAGLAAELDPTGKAAIGVAGDVTDQAACDHAVEEVVSAFGRIDGLVHNTVRYPVYGPVMTSDLGDWGAVFDANVVGAMRLTKSAVPAMSTDGASIVMINSMVTRKFQIPASSYAVTKGALMTAAQLLAKELGPAGIRVNSVVAGWMRGGPRAEEQTRRAARARGVDVAVIEEERASLNPLHYVPTLADIAQVVVFLLSDMSRSMTGEALNVSCGELLG